MLVFNLTYLVISKLCTLEYKLTQVCAFLIGSTVTVMEPLYKVMQSDKRNKWLWYEIISHVVCIFTSDWTHGDHFSVGFFFFFDLFFFLLCVCCCCCCLFACLVLGFFRRQYNH